MTGSKPFLSAEWRHLVMINFSVDPRPLGRYVPEGTELDFFEGHTYLSLVGFLFLRTRVLGITVPFHQSFEELNLRLYVKRYAESGWRRGVVFIKEVVPRIAVSAIARGVYGENYVALPMRHAIDNENGVLARARYDIRVNGTWGGIEVEPEITAVQPAEDSRERFISEHYWGYSERGGETLEYRVDHPVWDVWPARNHRVDLDLEHLYGEELASALRAKDSFAFLADGSAVQVFRSAGASPVFRNWRRCAEDGPSEAA